MASKRKDSNGDITPAELASRLLAARGDGFVVPTDMEDTPAGLKDLFSVLNSVAGQAPVLQRDWFLHPLQIVDAKEAGAAGVVGVIASVAGDRGTPVLSSFAAALGLDCPVEIVNLKELKAMEAMGVPFYGMNISVGLTVNIAGFGADVTHGLLGELPFGVASIAGVKSVEEARAAKLSGADALLIKKELVQQWVGNEAELVERLRDATCGDD